MSNFLKKSLKENDQVQIEENTLKSTASKNYNELKKKKYVQLMANEKKLFA
jgi:hypothetical protein